VQTGVPLSFEEMTTQPARVRKMFGSIARRYDLANHLLSCGIDFYWRRHAAEIVADWQPHRVADLATGTGDLALALQKKLPDADVVGVDVLCHLTMLHSIVSPLHSACAIWKTGRPRLLRCRACLSRTGTCSYSSSHCRQHRSCAQSIVSICIAACPCWVLF